MRVRLVLMISLLVIFFCTPTDAIRASPNKTLEISLANADLTYIGEDLGDWSAYSLSPAGDVNGDGLGDVLVGAPMAGDRSNPNVEHGAGKGYLILGKPDSEWPTSPASLALADASFLGEYSLDYASYYVSTAGDVNGDGYDDFLVGAFGGIENFVPGDAYIMLGRVAPLPVEFIPDALSGKIREWHSFTGEYWEPNGWSDINQVSLKVGKSTTDPKLLSVAFEPDSNALYLLDNFTDQWVGPCAPGAHIILQSSYFQLDCRNSSVQYYSDHLFKVSGGFAGYSLLSLRDS